MQAIDILMQEHRVIETVLNALESAADRLGAGEDVPMDFFFKAATSSATTPTGRITKKRRGFSSPPSKRTDTQRTPSRSPFSWMNTWRDAA